MDCQIPPITFIEKLVCGGKYQVRIIGEILSETKEKGTGGCGNSNLRTSETHADIRPCGWIYFMWKKYIFVTLGSSI